MTITAENELLQRITARPDFFGGKPIVRDMRIAVEHILGMLAAGDKRAAHLAGVSVSRTGGRSGMPGVCPPLAGRRAGA